MKGIIDKIDWIIKKLSETEEMELSNGRAIRYLTEWRNEIQSAVQELKDAYEDFMSDESEVR